MAREATIQRITTVSAVENADRLEKVQVLGWQVVVKKGEFQPGDLCVYMEIDSLLPERPEFEFMRPRGFRVKTAQLRGTLSQGIVFPLSILPDEQREQVQEGQDVSELLNVTHYEKPIPTNMAGIVRGGLPKYVIKTDEVRLQSAPEVIQELWSKECYISVKLDGTSATYSHFNGDCHVCGRTQSFKMVPENATNIYIMIDQKYGLTEKLKTLGNYVVQGELVGPGIQKNRLALKERDLFIFNVYAIDDRCYLNYCEAVAFAQHVGVPFVPVETVDTFHWTLPELLDMAKGIYPGTNNRREGIVIRPTTEMYSPSLQGRLSFKVVNNDYLLKDEE